LAEGTGEMRRVSVLFAERTGGMRRVAAGVAEVVDVEGLGVLD
jgi:hypothetical protein